MSIPDILPTVVNEVLFLKNAMSSWMSMYFMRFIHCSPCSRRHSSGPVRGQQDLPEVARDSQLGILSNFLDFKN